MPEICSLDQYLLTDIWASAYLLVFTSNSACMQEGETLSEAIFSIRHMNGSPLSSMPNIWMVQQQGRICLRLNQFHFDQGETLASGK